MAHPNILGKWLWHDLMTTDTSAAKEFYRKAVGWPSQPWDQDPSYTFVLGPQGPVAGLMGMPPDAPAGTPPFWSLYIGTPDLGATVAVAQRLGAKLCKEATEIPTIGRFAILTDPQGAAFTLFTPFDDSAPSNAPPPIGDFSWHELATTDFEAAFRFYSELFGWQEMERMDMGPNGIYFIFGWDGEQRGGMYNQPPGMPGPPNWLSYASVANTDASVARAKAAGGRVINGPMDVPGEGRVAIMMDPQGAVFAVHSEKAAPASKTPVAPSKTPPAKKKRKPAAKKAKAGGKNKRPARATAKRKTRKPAKTRKSAKARKPGKRRRGRAARG
jgi:predicted enzyme related to lactoylglutathione lyase